MLEVGVEWRAPFHSVFNDPDDSDNMLEQILIVIPIICLIFSWLRL